MMRAFENNDYPAYERYADLASTWTMLHGDDEPSSI
jgi:hypothetical protein